MGTISGDEDMFGIFCDEVNVKELILGQFIGDGHHIKVTNIYDTVNGKNLGVKVYKDNVEVAAPRTASIYSGRALNGGTSK